MSVLTNTFTDIANAIRSKGGTSDTIKPINMAQAIANLPSSSGIEPPDSWGDSTTIIPRTSGSSGWLQVRMQTDSQGISWLLIELSEYTGTRNYNLGEIIGYFTETLGFFWGEETVHPAVVITKYGWLYTYSYYDNEILFYKTPNYDDYRFYDR